MMMMMIRQVSELIKAALEQRDKPDEVRKLHRLYESPSNQENKQNINLQVTRIQVMETQVEQMKIEARRKLIEQVVGHHDGHDGHEDHGDDDDDGGR